MEGDGECSKNMLEEEEKEIVLCIVFKLGLGECWVDILQPIVYANSVAK